MPQATKPALLRGAALVERVIERVIANGEIPHPRPLPKRNLAELRLGNGARIPPALERWLTFDADWHGLFDDLDAPALKPLSISALVRD